VEDFMQEGITGKVKPDFLPKNEIKLQSVEVLSKHFYYFILEPGVKAYEELLYAEFGNDITFDYLVLDQKGIIYQLRLLDAAYRDESGGSESGYRGSEGNQSQVSGRDFLNIDCKVELWALLDCQRQGNFRICCRTLYDLKIKKRQEEQVTRTLETRYSEFNSLFGIKKHELDSSQLQMFGAKFLSTFKLFMPTMDMNRGDDENSDYEEEIFIQQKEISIVASARRVLSFQVAVDNKSTVQESRVVTTELLGLDGHEFLGIRVTQFFR
jgi:hypothetical protein